jgi:dihydropteroate synthase
MIHQLLGAARRGERTLVMGILNLTPDSFSDGGLYFSSDDAVRRAEAMIEEGADILDLGGESTRPGAEPLPVEEELRRVMPVVEALASRIPVPLSVDTYKAAVAERAVGAGASMVNDISALAFDPAMGPTVARLGVPVCLMHTRGTVRNMHRNPVYGDVVAEVKAELSARADAALAAGIARENIVLDPGFGFAKNAAHNLELLRRLRELTDLGYPLLAGWSRKSTIGKVLGGPPVEDRLEGTAATVALSIAYGAAIVRVHDVREMARVARMTDAVVRGNGEERDSEFGIRNSEEGRTT